MMISGQVAGGVVRKVVGGGKALEGRRGREGRETTLALDWLGSSADLERTSAGLTEKVDVGQVQVIGDLERNALLVHC